MHFRNDVYTDKLRSETLRISLVCPLQEGENVVLIADIGGTNCRFELWHIDLQDSSQHRELFHIVRALEPCFAASQSLCLGRPAGQQIAKR